MVLVHCIATKIPLGRGVNGDDIAVVQALGDECAEILVGYFLQVACRRTLAIPSRNNRIAGSTVIPLMRGLLASCANKPTEEKTKKTTATLVLIWKKTPKVDRTLFNLRYYRMESNMVPSHFVPQGKHGKPALLRRGRRYKGRRNAARSLRTPFVTSFRASRVSRRYKREGTRLIACGNYVNHEGEKYCKAEGVDDCCDD